MSRIHPTAIIDGSAQIAETATIGPFCIIGSDVTIGPGTQLHNHVTVQKLTSIGSDNEIFPYAVIGADPQDRKFNGEKSFCEIGDRNKIREHVTIHRGTECGGGMTRIGNDNLFMVAAHIAHDCYLNDHVVICNQVMLAGHVLVENFANIGGGVGVHHFASIGTCAFVAGMARIGKDVPPFMLVEGNPAEVRSVNTLAMGRCGYNTEQIETIKDAYRRLWRDNGAAMAVKMRDLRRDYPKVAAISKLCDALDASAKGVHGRALELARTDDKRSVAIG